jgi:hypothetical protein
MAADGSDQTRLMDTSTHEGAPDWQPLPAGP